MPPTALPPAPQVAPGAAQPPLRRPGAAVLLGSGDTGGHPGCGLPPLFFPFFFPPSRRGAEPGAAPGAAPVPAPLRFPLPGTWAAAAGPGASRSTAAARKGGRGGGGVEKKRGRPRAGRAGAERGGAEAPAPGLRGRVRVSPWGEAGPVSRPRRGGEDKSSDAPGHREVPACPSWLGSPVASVTERRRGSGPAAAAAP